MQPHLAGELVRNKITAPSQLHARPNHQVGVTHHVQDICLASHTSFGILDLGATETVIGTDHIKPLLDGLDPSIRRKVSIDAHIKFFFDLEIKVHSGAVTL